MKTVLIVILVIGCAGLAYYLIGGDKEVVPAEMDNTVEEVDTDQVQEALQETGARTVYASCNAIAGASTCMDYVGSMWNDDNSAELNCGETGVFSTDACPYAEFGGCQMNGGSVMETIAWAYAEGPGGYDDESVAYASMSCNSLPQGRWVTPDELLE
ncbi:MAG: hypothetical protein WC544_01870 [Patescibacteria group bacterium]